MKVDDRVVFNPQAAFFTTAAFNYRTYGGEVEAAFPAPRGVNQIDGICYAFVSTLFGERYEV